jgi:two-component system, LytTR family, response regulator
MSTIRCIVVDDEPLAARLMESYVRKTPFLSLEGTFTGGAAAFAFLQEHAIDLLFCDIQMPGLNGMELSRMLPERTRIIFTTAFSNYALEGFKVRALDYLLKPISYADFLSSAMKAKEYFEMVERASQTVDSAAADASNPVVEPVETTISPVSPSGANLRSIFVKTEYRLQQIELDKITYIEGLKDYVKIHLNDGTQPVLSLMRLKNLEEKLPGDRFVRVHKSYIVQLSQIEAIERSHILIGSDRIPIGESYQPDLFQRLSITK